MKLKTILPPRVGTTYELILEENEKNMLQTVSYYCQSVSTVVTEKAGCSREYQNCLNEFLSVLHGYLERGA